MLEPFNGLSLMPSIVLSCRQVTSITIPAAHDAADATRCSQKGRKCICKVRRTEEQSVSALPEKDDLTVFVGLCIIEGGILLAEQLLNPPQSVPELPHHLALI